MTGASIARRPIRSYLVLAFTAVIAVLGVFPFNLLYAVPLAASLTLTGLARPVRLAVAACSAAALLIGAVQAVALVAHGA